MQGLGEVWPLNGVASVPTDGFCDVILFRGLGMIVDEMDVRRDL